MYVCVGMWVQMVGSTDCSLPHSIRSIHVHSGYEAPGRQVMSPAVKIAPGNPIALIYEACQYPDCNNALARR